MAEGYTLAEIARRDRYTCGLCHKRVAMKQQMPHPRSPVVDHIMPIARGGDDTKANVWLAHWYCNAVKGARLITHQAALF
jgi:5-methylcytosine-specific restriction endonuclease McrA